MIHSSFLNLGCRIPKLPVKTLVILRFQKTAPFNTKKVIGPLQQVCGVSGCVAVMIIENIVMVMVSLVCTVTIIVVIMVFSWWSLP